MRKIDRIPVTDNAKNKIIKHRKTNPTPFYRKVIRQLCKPFIIAILIFSEDQKLLDNCEDFAIFFFLLQAFYGGYILFNVTFNNDSLVLFSRYLWRNSRIFNYYNLILSTWIVIIFINNELYKTAIQIGILTILYAKLNTFSRWIVKAKLSNLYP